MKTKDKRQKGKYGNLTFEPDLLPQFGEGREGRKREQKNGGKREGLVLPEWESEDGRRCMLEKTGGSKSEEAPLSSLRS